MATLDEKRVRQMIREELARKDSSSRFQLNNIPNHTHNGVDSVPVVSPTFTYIGFVPYDVGADPLLGTILPPGWSMSLIGGTTYTVTHNLNTLLYAVVAAPTQSTNEKVSYVLNPFRNSFEIIWFKTSNDAATTTSFNFILTQINNKSVGQPLYTTVNRT